MTGGAGDGFGIGPDRFVPLPCGVVAVTGMFSSSCNVFRYWGDIVVML